MENLELIRVYGREKIHMA